MVIKLSIILLKNKKIMFFKLLKKIWNKKTTLILNKFSLEFYKNIIQKWSMNHLSIFKNMKNHLKKKLENLLENLLNHHLKDYLNHYRINILVKILKLMILNHLKIFQVIYF